MDNRHRWTKREKKQLAPPKDRTNTDQHERVQDGPLIAESTHHQENRVEITPVQPNHKIPRFLPEEDTSELLPEKDPFECSTWIDQNHLAETGPFGDVVYPLERAGQEAREKEDVESVKGDKDIREQEDLETVCVSGIF
ncbi:MAG: hypothetical protein Q9187_001297 [Circinaria calcarea]